MKHFKKLTAIALCLASTLFFAACGSGNTADNSDRTDVVIAMTVGSEPEYGFDPIMGWGDTEHLHEPLIQSTLIATDTNMNFVNDLATDYSCSDDGLVWTFTIRDDVSFTNGDPLTASDVAFTFNKILDTEETPVDLSMLDKAVAVDDTTVQLILNKPFSAFLYTVAVVGIVPENAYDENYGENPIGSGRYMLDQWDRGQQAILVANPDYYGEAPKIDKVTALFYGTIQLIQSGDADLCFTSASYASTEIEGYSVRAYDTVDCLGVSLPCIPAGDTKVSGGKDYPAGNDVTCNLALRRAMAYALDREALTDQVLGGYGTPAFSVTDGMPWASEKIQIEPDIEKAKQILADGGWKDSDGDGYLDLNGVRAKLDLYFDESDATRQETAIAFSDQMKEIGVDITVYPSDWDTIYDHQFSDLVLWGWGSNSPAEFYDLTYSTGWGNFSCYEDKKVDELLDKAMESLDTEKSNAYYQQAMEAVSADGACTWIWLENVDHLYFVRDGLNITDQKIHPHGHGWSIVNNVDQWSWGE